MPDLLDMVKKLEEGKAKKEASEPLTHEKKDIKIIPISESKKIKSTIKDVSEEKGSQIPSFVGIEELTKTSINAPIRIMMSIVTQLKMFDINSNGLTPKGRNKKELKIEIKNLVSKLSEK